jgi:hypothetical protein
MTSFIAAGGSGRSTSLIPAVPAACSVTTIAFMGIVLDHSSLWWKCCSDRKPVRHPHARGHGHLYGHERLFVRFCLDAAFDV